PENSMLQRLSDGRESVKLIDFGIAKIERCGLESGATTVMLNGTVRYMAPEQFSGESQPSSDIYSLALVACEMLCGHPDARALPRRLDLKVRRCLDSALAFHPDQRPPRIGEWAEQLADALTAAPRRRFILAAGGAAAVVAGSSYGGSRWLMAPEEARDVEKSGAFDPLSEHFQIHNELYGTVSEDASKTGYDGWRVITRRQGHYYKHLSRHQKRTASSRGWVLSTVLRAEEGI